MRRHLGLFMIVALIGACFASSKEDDEAVCGNGKVEPGEECDGDQLAGVTCELAGYDAPGNVTCDETCTIDLAACISTCNGKNLEPDEICDGDKFGGDTCVEYGFTNPGTLACNECQTVDTSACMPSCDGALREPGELCDGDDLGGYTCADHGYVEPAGLACAGSCQFDTSGCHATCGNGVTEPGEDCDEPATPGQTCMNCQYQPVINELYYNGTGNIDLSETGCYIELKGTPFFDLDGYSIHFVSGADGMEYRESLALVGEIPSSGYFVIAQSAAQPSNQISDSANLLNGPNNLILKMGDDVVDAVGYGFGSGADYFMGEGTSAPGTGEGKSLSRSAGGADTGHNDLDFHVSAQRTPGEPNQ